MEEIIKITVENGIPVASFLILIYLIFWDKKQTNAERKEEREYQKATNSQFIKSLENINENMIITNERLATLENKRKKKEDE